MQRASVKFETLNETFFQSFFQQAPGAKLLNLYAGATLVSGFLFVEQANSIAFLFVSKEKYADAYDSYFCLLSALIKYGLIQRKAVIYLGQTTYKNKTSYKGRTEGLYLFFKLRQPLLNIFFKKISKWIFPENAYKDL